MHSTLFSGGTAQTKVVWLALVSWFQREKLSEQLKFNVAKLSICDDIQGTEGSDRAKFGQHEKAYTGWRLWLVVLGSHDVELERTLHDVAFMPDLRPASG